MKLHAFLIQTHDDPDHLRFLIESMNAPWTYFFVHVDAKFDVAPFRAAVAGLERVAFVEDRTRVFWGGWSIAKATLDTLALARGTRVPFDYFTLMSGNHFPVRPLQEIQDHVSAHGLQYISLIEAPNEDGKPISKFNRYHIEGAFRVSGTLANLRGGLYRAIGKLPLRNPYSYLPAGWKLYAGSQWWTLSEAAVAHIEDCLGRHPRIVDLFRFVHCADESIFHTILGNSPFGGRCTGCTVYTDWSNPAEAPAWIRKDHLPYLLNDPMIDNMYGRRQAHFVRKVGTRNRDVAELILRGG